jgi:hypothetical protein
LRLDDSRMDVLPRSPDLLDRSTSDASAAAVLGISATAPLDEIRAAYRRRAKEMHPDHRADKDDAAFREVQWAYEWLTNPAQRCRAQVSATARQDVIVLEGQEVERSWNTAFAGYHFMIRGPRSVAAFHVVRDRAATRVYERQLVQAPARHRKQFPRTYIVLHGLLFPVTRPNARVLAMELVHLDPTSPSPYAVVGPHRSWLLVRQRDGRLFAQNSRRGFSRLGGYAAFSDASGTVVPIGGRIFPPFEAPLAF